MGSHPRERRCFLCGTGATLLLPLSRARQDVQVIATSFASRGRSIRVALMRPASPTPLAGVVYLHGSGSIGPRQLRYAERFAERGIMSAVPVYTDAAPDDGVRSRPIMQAWRDCAADAVEWLVTQGAPQDRMVLAGYSLGSHIAVDSALQGGRCRATIGIAAGWDVYPPRPPRRRIPALIIRAGSDDHVRPGSTDRLVTFLRDANVPVSEAHVRDAEHIMTEDQWATVHDRSMDFLTDVLGLPGRA